MRIQWISLFPVDINNLSVRSYGHATGSHGATVQRISNRDPIKTSGTALERESIRFYGLECRSLANSMGFPWFFLYGLECRSLANSMGFPWFFLLEYAAFIRIHGFQRWSIMSPRDFVTLSMNHGFQWQFICVLREILLQCRNST